MVLPLTQVPRVADDECEISGDLEGLENSGTVRTGAADQR
jgi:hypothetical protein